MRGGLVPILKILAINNLSSLACQICGCTHKQKRNCLELKSLQALVFVKVNNHLKKNIAKKQKADSKPIDLDQIDAYVDDFEAVELQEEGGGLMKESEEVEVEVDACLDASEYNLDGLLQFQNYLV